MGYLIHEPTAHQVPTKNDILACVEHDMDGTGIRRLSHVRVDFTRLVALPRREKLGDVCMSGLHTGLEVSAGILGVRALEVIVADARDAERDCFELGPEEVILVQEEDHGCLGEPRRVDNFVKQLDGLIDTVRLRVLIQNLIVLRNGGNEDDSGYVIKRVNPLLTLVTLASNIYSGGIGLVHGKRQEEQV